MAITSIYFNNKNSYTDFGLICEDKPSIPLTLEDIELIEIEGRSGTLTRRLGTYKDKIITFNFSIINQTNFYRNIDDILNWLNYISDNNLTFSFDLDRKYKVKAVQIGENIQQEVENYGVFEVTFICEPFRYPVTDNTVTQTIKTFTVTNSGNVKSEPYFKIYGSGNITLSVNGQVTTINNLVGYVELDSAYYLCYKGTTNMMSNMLGDFPKLEIGTNNIVLTGTVTQVDINIRTRYL